MGNEGQNPIFEISTVVSRDLPRALAAREVACFQNSTEVAARPSRVSAKHSSGDPVSWAAA